MVSQPKKDKLFWLYNWKKSSGYLEERILDNYFLLSTRFSPNFFCLTIVPRLSSNPTLHCLATSLNPLVCRPRYFWPTRAEKSGTIRGPSRVRLGENKTHFNRLQTFSLEKEIRKKNCKTFSISGVRPGPAPAVTRPRLAWTIWKLEVAELNL